MNASSRPASAKHVFSGWMHWSLNAVGFVLTLWALQDAEITMIVAHYQWEIHEEAALKIALWVGANRHCDLGSSAFPSAQTTPWLKS